MALSIQPSPPAINFWPALLDVVCAAFMVFVLSTYLQLVMAMAPGARDIEAERLRAFEAQFVRSLAATPYADEVTVERTSLGRIRIRFNASLLFATSDYQLKDSGARVLTWFGGFLASALELGVREIQIAGHTDDEPFARSASCAATGACRQYPKNNWELSSARATAVTLFLLDGGFGLPPARFSANGRGEYQPIADNASAEGKASNRRVEVDIVFEGRP